MIRRSAMLVAAAFVTVAGPCLAQDEVVVAATKPAAPPPAASAAARTETSAATPATDKAQVMAWLSNASQPSLAARAAAEPAPAKKAERQSLVHGSAGVSIGTGGYRSAYATAVMPVGDNGMLGLAVSHTDYGKNAMPYYGYGYGYGRHGYGYGRRGGSSDAFGLSYMSVEDDDPATPDGCAPGFRAADGRYLEPLWVTQMNGGRDCKTSQEQP